MSVLSSTIAFAPLSHATPAAAPAATGHTWRVIPAQSSLGFAGSMAGKPFSGTFDRFDAHIRFDPAAPQTAQVRVSIDMTSARTGDAEKDAALPQGEWFDTANYSTASFVTTAVRATTPGHFSAQGTLTLKGRRQPVRLPFSLAIDGTVARMSGSLTIDRRAFAVGTGGWASDQWIAYPVSITVRLMAQAVPDVAR